LRPWCETGARQTDTRLGLRVRLYEFVHVHVHFIIYFWLASPSHCYILPFVR
jgi:hypothetical protein